jgi:hypothetical protein
MNRPHLSDDELIGLLYGLGDAEEHVAACPECGVRLTAMREARAATIDTPQISGRILAAQRQQILDRLERPSFAASWQRLLPVAGAASLLAVALFLSRPSGVPAPAPTTPAAVNAEADEELFTDVYSMERDVEPRAAAPIRALFQETALEEERQ